MIRKTAFTLALTLAVLGLGGLTSSAQAANAPNCVKAFLTDSGFRDYLKVTNTCKSTLRLKVKLAFLTDVACTSYSPGQSRSYNWGYPGRFDGVVTC